MSEPSERPRRSLVRFGLPVLFVAGCAAAFAVYGIGGGDKAAAACAASAETLAAVRQAAVGEVAALVTPDAPRPLPALVFKDDAGADIGLDRFKGKVVLLNLWATWCVPCRKEMPALDALKAEKAGAGFDVVAVSMDLGSADKPRAFLKDIGTKQLALYADPTNKSFRDLRAVGRGVGLPTSILLDRAGCEIGYLPGAAEWASPDALKLIDAALGK